MRGMFRPKAACAAVRPRRGLSIIYIVLMLVVLVGFVSLAVDVGRIRLARAELQTAADAAARAGVLSLPVNSATVIDQATVAADSNKVIDAGNSDPNHLGGRTNPGLVLDDVEDIKFGIWKPSAAPDQRWTELTYDGSGQDDRRRANAVHVTGRRTQDRNNPVPLIFAPVVGVFSTDLEREAIAYITGGPIGGYGFIGLDSVSSNGTGATVDSMHYGTNGTGGGVASDGDIDLGNGDVYGDARPGMNGGEVEQKSNSIVTGWMAPLDLLLRNQPQFQPVTTPNGTPVFNPPNNGDWIIPPTGSATSTDPNNPKKYYLNGNMTLNGNKKISIRGYVSLYVNGNVKIDGNHVINDAVPQNPGRFLINVVKANTTVDIGGNASQYSHIHAPLSDVKIHGGANMHYYGWITGKTLDFIGSSNLHYDESRVVPARPYQIRLVK